MKQTKLDEGKNDENPSFDDTRDDEFGYVATFINEALLTMRASQESAWDAKELAEVTLHSIGDSVITTDREGRFVCELPVRLRSGLTYDIQVTWPRDVGGDIEQKSITLNADRTLFTVPFYRQLSASNSE